MTDRGTTALPEDERAEQERIIKKRRQRSTELYKIKAVKSFGGLNDAE